MCGPSCYTHYCTCFGSHLFFFIANLFYYLHHYCKFLRIMKSIINKKWTSLRKQEIVLLLLLPYFYSYICCAYDWVCLLFLLSLLWGYPLLLLHLLYLWLGLSASFVMSIVFMPQFVCLCHYKLLRITWSIIKEIW